jgi:hypothetical protein
VAGVVRLQQIDLTSLRCSRAANPPPEGQSVRLDLKVSGSYQLTDGLLITEVRFRARTAPATLEADAVFTLRYELARPVTGPDADSFTKHNAVFNAWPYWRELVQNFAVRMGLAPLTMPLLRA